MKELQKAIEKYIAANGLEMNKMIRQSSSGGLFGSYTPATYDERTVYSYKDALELAKEGFTLDGSQDIGVFLLNAIMNYEKESDKKYA